MPALVWDGLVVDAVTLNGVQKPTTALLSGGLSPLKRIALSKQYFAEQNWHKVLEVTAEIPAGQSLVLFRRAAAAIELRDDAAIAAAVDLCRADWVDPRIALTIASRLINIKNCEQAWRILADVPPQDGPMLRKLLRRLSLQVQIRDPVLYHAARARWIKLGPTTAQKSANKAAAPRTSLVPPYAFPEPADPAEDTGAGYCFAVINAGRVAAMHEQGYETEMAHFGQIIAGSQPPRLIEYRDVFVNRLGQIWRADGTVLESANRPLPDRWSSQAFEHVDEAVLSTDSTHGFYHWYAERLPALAWRLAPGAPTIPILIGSHAGAFQDETFRLLGVPAEQVIRIGDIFHCGRVFIGKIRVGIMRQWSRYGFVYDRLAAAAAIDQRDVQHPKRIYISRRDTKRRRLVNEAEIEDAMTALGVVPLVFSEMSLAAQIAVVSQADFVSGPHGAGLTHILAHPPGLPIFELHPAQTGSYALRLTMARLSRAKGHDHTLWLEPVNALTRDWTADRDGVVATVETKLAGLR